LAERALSAAVAGGGLLLVSLLYRALRGRDGLGLGDVKLIAGLAAWLSLAQLAPLLLLASLLGLAHAGVERWRETRAGSAGPVAAGPRRVPFGACLALAAFPLWLFSAASGAG
jgi:leader peptidase (prepilin peptidase)/N-methyltransferase